MVDYIDRHKAEFGVEPICTVLQVAPSTYYAAKTRPPSARRLRDDVIKAAMLLIWEANYSVYGVRKLWKAMLREGHIIGRDQTAGLMRELGIRGVRRRGPRPSGSSMADLVLRCSSGTPTRARKSSHAASGSAPPGRSIPGGPGWT